MTTSAETESIANQLEPTKYEVIHITDERIRICVPRIHHDLEYTNRLKRLVESLNFVTDVRISSAASSLVVNYNASMAANYVLPEIATCIQQASIAQIGIEPVSVNTFSGNNNQANSILNGSGDWAGHRKPLR